MSDDAERVPWTIKAVSVETRKLAVASAAREGLTMGEWIDRAVRNQSELDRSNQVIPPGQTGQFMDTGATGLVPVASVKPPDEAGKPAMDLAGLADALRAVAAFAGAADMPASKSLAREAAALLREQIRDARGLPGKRGQT